MPVVSRSFSNAYQDSVKLMRVASDAIDRHGVADALAVMATDENKSMVVDAGLLAAEDLVGLGPNDLLVAVEDADAETAERALDDMAAAIRGRQAAAEHPGEGSAPAPKSLASAAARLPDANLALISVPGAYAAREAWKALHAGLHVHVFSDNVDVEDERALKAFARDADQLVMGPDCGTAIINGVPLGFANAVSRGSVGVVAAAGTGLQEVTTLLDRAGAGVSQAIGTGGRDLSAAVGGLTMQQGLEYLGDDPATAVIVLVSKPPAPAAREAVLEAVAACSTPVVCCFLGGDPDAFDGTDVVQAETLAGAARAALEAQPGQENAGGSFAGGVDGFTEPAAAEAIARRRGEPDPDRRDVRGLFTGGTFALEAVARLEAQVGPVGSNVDAGTALDDPGSPTGHAVVDLGADEFTRGRPHPMIEPRPRTAQLRAALDDDSVLVVLLDVVLGYGAHADPAGPVAAAVSDAGGAGWPAVVASVCGTAGDPQDWPSQVGKLVDAGALVAETNADAARFAAELWAAAGSAGGEPS